MNNTDRYPLLCGTDTTGGVSNIILKKLVEAGKKKNKPYGDDDFTELAKIEFKNIFKNKNLEIIPMISGTASNAFALSLMTKKNDYIICHNEAHIFTSECGAPEFFNSGIKLITISSNDGKLDSTLINDCLEDNVDKNIVGISVSQLSENGTNYSIESLKKIGDICKKNNLFFHMDGARFSNAVCNLKVKPSEMTWKIGLDCLTIGATKNGAFAAEAIIFFNKKKICNYKFFQKRSGHVIAKTKFISSQFIAWFQDDLWLKLAKKSNNIAKSFKNYLVQNKNFEILFPIDGNEVFVRVHELYYQEIMNKNVFPKLWSTSKNKLVILRFVFSFDFTKKDLKNLISRINNIKIDF